MFSHPSSTLFVMACLIFATLKGPLTAQPPSEQLRNLVHWAWDPQAVEATNGQFWPEFRGPHSDGTAPEAKPVIEWSESQNLVWKQPIQGQGWSSPVVWGDEIWLTTATLDGKSMSILALRAHDGSIRIDRVVFTNETVQKDHHVTNSYASPSPVLDEKCCYVHFGAYGTAAIDRQSGTTLWERRDLPCNHYRGPGSSPILFGDLLLFHMDGFDFKYVIALDKRTGKTVWKTDRDIEYGTDDGDVHKAYTTPTLIETPWGLQMVSVSSKATIAYNPWNGKPLWRVRYGEFSTTARPIFDGTHVFINTGYGKSHLLAVRPAAEGDITDTHIDWDVSRGIGNKPSHVWYKDWIFSLEDRGTLVCLDRHTGEQKWQARLGGDFSASPLLAHDRLYVFDHDGAGYVFAADDRGEKLATNTLPSGCRASPAAFKTSLLVRTTEAVYLFRAPETP